MLSPHIWGRCPIWLIFFRRVDISNQLWLSCVLTAAFCAVKTVLVDMWYQAWGCRSGKKFFRQAVFPLNRRVSFKIERISIIICYIFCWWGIGRWWCYYLACATHHLRIVLLQFTLLSIVCQRRLGGGGVLDDAWNNIIDLGDYFLISCIPLNLPLSCPLFTTYVSNNWLSWTPKNLQNAGFTALKVWVILIPKNEGCGFPWWRFRIPILYDDLEKS